ncbi:MAG: tRNA (guanine(46)-N(7))-methyltransferase TrmB [Verrucomicrobiia bacterium]|tara:strand:- start:6460 stop:7050 length:591 start_codon:yes stop_codon:yes gene_type:complete
MPPIEEAQAINAQRIAELRVTLADLPLDHPQLTLEIGCGHGHYLAAYAEKNPAEHSIAIDIIKERLEKAARKTDRAGVTNVSWLRASAEHFFEALPSEVRFNGRIFILFPDPWPKRKHGKNRLIKPDFLHALATFTRTGTELCFRTDHDPYFAEALAVVSDHPEWNVTPDAEWPFEQRTVFEARADSHQSWIARRA